MNSLVLLLSQLFLMVWDSPLPALHEACRENVSHGGIVTNPLPHPTSPRPPVHMSHRSAEMSELFHHSSDPDEAISCFPFVKLCVSDLHSFTVYLFCPGHCLSIVCAAGSTGTGSLFITKDESKPNDCLHWHL